MALIERIGEQYQPTDGMNPYALALDSPQVLSATAHLVATEQPIIDRTTNPEIESDGNNYAVYFLGSDHPDSLIARAVEGKVYQEKWEYSAAQTQAESVGYEDNSYFFLVIDVTSSFNPKPAVSLRIADCLEGGSATVDYFQEINTENADAPVELKVSEEDKEKKLWDIVGVMAPNEYRNGTVSVWAYHALYRKSLELGIGRWISSIVDKEYKNLSSLGIPFRAVSGISRALLYLSRSNKKLGFGFYTANVDEIHEEVTEQITKLESTHQDVEINKFIANLARLALHGTTRPIDSRELVA